MTSPFVRDLVAWSEAAPGEIAVATPHESITTAELVGRVSSLASSLLGAGVREGQVIAVSSDSPDEIVAFLAANVAGAIPVATPSQGEFTASHADRLVHSGREWAPANSLDMELLKTTARPPMVDRIGPAPSAAVLTSGTTGQPKLLLVDDDIVDARLAGYVEWWPTKDFVNLFRISAISGLFAMAAAFHSRTTYYSVPIIDRAAVDFCRDGRISRLAGSPHHIQSLIDTARHAGGTLRFETVTSAGAQQTAPFIAAVRSVCGGEIRSVYGSTEAGGVAIAHESVEGAFRGVIGRGAEFDISDDGEVRYRSPGLARNYRIGHEIVPVAPDGWFYPGDIGHIDELGRIVIERRVDDVVNVAGAKVNPLEFEALAESVDGVKDAGCAGVTFPDGSAHLVLAVVVRDQLNYQAVITAFTALPENNRPNIVVAVPSIPRNRNGKIQRDELASTLTAAIRVQPPA